LLLPDFLFIFTT